MRNVLKVSELSKSKRKCIPGEVAWEKMEYGEVGGVESAEEWEKFRDIVMECTNDM